MQNVTRRLAVALTGAVAVLAFFGAGQAQAELCDTGTRICVVNPPTAASPWLAPQLVQLRLPTETNLAYSGASWMQPGVSEGEYPRSLESDRYPIKGGLQLVEAGPPGGTSLYQGTIEPIFGQTQVQTPLVLPVDGALTLSVVSKSTDPACNCVKEAVATFPGLPVLAPLARLNRRIVRSGKWFRAIMSLEARTPLRVSQIFYVSGFDGKQYDLFPHPLLERKVTASGPVRIEQKLSTRYVHRQCRAYRRCTLWADGEMGIAAESSLADRLLPSVPRPVTAGQGDRPQRHSG